MTFNAIAIARCRLPLRDGGVDRSIPSGSIMPKTPIIASHLVFTGYGHWLPNDPRGSGSTRIKKPELMDLGAPHVGRKSIQPTRDALRAFHRQAETKLSKPRIWFDESMRRALAVGFDRAIRANRYTAYAAAILRNHAHLCVRRHRDTPEKI